MDSINFPSKTDLIEHRFSEAKSALNNFLLSKDNLNAVNRFAEKIFQTISTGGKIISFGNGGSMCDAMHFAEELTGRFRSDRRPLPALAISDPSHISCVANDYGYDQVFSRYVEGVGKKGDLVIGITTSGNSPNILNAFQAAKQKSISSFALLGKDGGLALSSAEDFVLVSEQASDRIQEIHIKILHIAIEATEFLLSKNNLL